MSGFRGRFHYGDLPEFEYSSAVQLLAKTSLHNARPLVAFDMLQRKETIVKKDRKEEPQAEIKRCRDGDSKVYSAIDSAVKAAFHWSGRDYRDANSFVSLYVPVVVLSMPFWDVCIDDGKVDEPQLSHAGYQLASYPDGNKERTVLTLVCSAERFPKIVEGLNEVFNWLHQEAQLPDFERTWWKESS